MKILYLYAEVMGYTISTINQLAVKGHEVHVIHWDHKKLTPYMIQAFPNVFFYNRSELNFEQLTSLSKEIFPTITVISGWMDVHYMRLAKYLRREGHTVVIGLDSQWHGSIKQCLMSTLARCGFFSKFYSHAWVSGIYQFEYARKLGFSKNKILYDILSADLSLFNQAFVDNVDRKTSSYPHRFLYVGRFESVKGLDTLLQAWKILESGRADWELHLVGDGKLKSELVASDGVIVKDFMQPEQLVKEAANAGCFLLPSRFEPWGVVLHEFAAAGLPLITSDVVGSASTFLISGLNGFIFKSNDSEALANRMQKIINMSDEQLLQMAMQSNALSQRITPETSACNLISLAL